ncbi:MAG: hypothetical protein ACRD3W_05310, partial [Terriglobales bacterium]
MSTRSPGRSFKMSIPLYLERRSAEIIKETTAVACPGRKHPRKRLDGVLMNLESLGDPTNRP